VVLRIRYVGSAHQCIQRRGVDGAHFHVLRRCQWRVGLRDRLEEQRAKSCLNTGASQVTLEEADIRIKLLEENIERIKALRKKTHDDIRELELRSATLFEEEMALDKQVAALQKKVC
jgi:hypothetical protein